MPEGHSPSSRKDVSRNFSCGFSLYLTGIYHNAAKLSGGRGRVDADFGWAVVLGGDVSFRFMRYWL
jgi:hypothetical protein